MWTVGGCNKVSVTPGPQEKETLCSGKDLQEARPAHSPVQRGPRGAPARVHTGLTPTVQGCVRLRLVARAGCEEAMSAFPVLCTHVCEGPCCPWM